jgi:uncharacterized membrane protein YcaP (DUF421 family)
MVFASPHDLLRVIVVGICAYTALVILLRVTGKRTLSKMNAFDFVVTVALGSILASTILNSEVSLSKGLLAVVLLCGLQFAVTYMSVRWKPFSRLVKSEPKLLFFNSQWLPDAMRQERVTEDEVIAAAREHGIGDLSNVRAVVLETNGTISIIRSRRPFNKYRQGHGPTDAARPVPHLPD